MLIAIDGPAASGKSTTAKLLATKLKIGYLDTGAMYRAITLKFLEENVDLKNIAEIQRVLDSTKISLNYSEKGLTVLLDEKDVSEAIRTPEINKAISKISNIPEVRKKMVALQRQIGQTGSWVVDGRDIGTVVFTNADLKIFMVATPEVRAKRRLIDYEAKGISASFDEIVDEIKKRDEYDSNRKHSPLKPAEDSILLDTSDLSLEEQVDFIYQKTKKI
ncbi:MAG: (d)CMP kinase [Calditrichaeota bacterium]|nr:MAG: (d)CMP kinase [Calditrichota bacterium]